MAAQDIGRTFIAPDSSIDGKILGKDVTIAGKFKGEIQITGSLVLAASASVDSTVQAESVEVGGTISGKIAARKVVVLETGRVTGTLDAGQLVVHEGAVLNGPVAAGRSATPTSAPAPAGIPPTPPAAKS